MNTVRLNPTGLQGDQLPKFSWEATAPGQTNFICMRANEEGIRLVVQGHKVMLFSTKKVPDLLKIIEESFRYLDLPSAKPQDNLIVRKGHMVLAVMKNDTTFVVESHFKELKYCEYCKSVPQLHRYRIFSSYHEMAQYLEEVERLII